MAGLYLLAYRLLLLPMSTLGLAISHVYLEKASCLKKNKNELAKVSLIIFKKLILTSVFPLSFLIVFGEEFFAFVLGEEWRVSGVMVQLLAPMIFVYFSTSFLMNLFIILEKQKESFYFSPTFKS